MRLRLLTLVVLLSAGLAFGQTSQPATRPAAKAQRALIVSIDGLRPDVLLRAKTPNLHALYESGAFSFWAQTTDVAITLPSHTSMLTGVTPDVHGVTWNDDRAITPEMHPKRPTLFELAKQAGYTTALVSGKAKFVALARPGTVDWVSVPSRTVTDSAVASSAAGIIRDHRPEVLFVHFANCDSVGHAKGWGSPEQLAAAEKADEALGVVLAALDEAKVRDQTFIIVSADHGGAGRTHGGLDARSRHIPWIAAGPSVRKNLDLTTYRELTVNTEDTFATTLSMLGIPLPDNIKGKFVTQILISHELMHEAK